MKQRVGVFIALIASDELILLDEPTNGLDPNGINSLLTLIKKLAKNHGLTLLSQVIFCLILNRFVRKTIC